MKNNIIRLAFGLLFFILGLIFDLLPFYLVSYIILGYDIFIKSFNNIKNKDFFDENTLMLLATVCAFLISKNSEAVLVIMLYQIGETLSDYAVDSSKEKIAKLMDLRVDTARVIDNNKETMVESCDVKIGDVVLVKPGEKVPLDGVCLSSSVSLDTKSLTGEALPVVVSLDDEVLSGSIVLNKPIMVKVTKRFDDCTVSKIVKFMMDADTNKTDKERFITRFSKVYTPIICALALLIFLIPTVLGYDFKVYLYKALIFLVISCPCALVISVPLSFFSGIGRCSKEGILVKNTMILEKALLITTIFYDKTGTLTNGEFEVVDIVPSKGVSSDKLKELSTAAEIYSNHPLSNVLSFDYKILKKDVKDLEEVAGKGIRCLYKNKELLVGKFKENNLKVLGSVVNIIYDGKYMGYIVISDTLKKESKDAVSRLKKMGIEQVMLTGDNETFAKKIASKLGINYKASLLPIDKAKNVSRALSNDKVVAFVGDGINDAPSLVTSDIGISMGSIGSDVALEASQVVLMNDNLNGIEKLINISKYTDLKIKENIIFALCFKILILILGLFGSVSIYMAIFADVGVMLLTILNSLLIFKKKFD